MYKELLNKRGNEIYFDRIPMVMNEEVKPYYFELITAILRKKHINYQIVTKETVTEKYDVLSTKILVDEHKFDEIKKDIYMFTKVACSVEYVDNFNVNDFSDIDLALDYSINLQNRLNEYHLIKKNDFRGYAVHHTFEQYDPEELEAKYNNYYAKVYTKK